MTNFDNKFLPHISLKLAKTGSASTRRFVKKPSSLTAKNLRDRSQHGSKLQTATSNLINTWDITQKERQIKGKPEIDKVIPLILQIDSATFDLDNFKSYDIEIMAELENGYIIGASSDVQLSKLQKKINQFIKQIKGGKTVGAIWELVDQLERPEYILSSELLDKWPQLTDEEILYVEVSLACVSSKYTPQNYQEWDEQIKMKIEDDITKFIDYYQGHILHIFDGDTNENNIPDSFSCTIKICGKGFKDLVLNFPYIFEIASIDQLEPIIETTWDNPEQKSFKLESPSVDAPKVCVIDSGIQEGHSLLKNAIDSQFSISWVTGEEEQTNDLVKGGGHGTRVAGAILYPQGIPITGEQTAICWLQNARVLDKDNKLNNYSPKLLSEIVKFYYGKTQTRIYNHSIASATPCRTNLMSSWAAEIDYLTWQNDILFIVSAGNIPMSQNIGSLRKSVQHHLADNNPYPNYLLEKSARIANPAQSFQAITVGSIAHTNYQDLDYTSIAQKDEPSAFSCSGFGIWNTIKPEVVEYGGDYIKNNSTPPDITWFPEVCPELVRSTTDQGPARSTDIVGTSFATPKVTHIAACLAKLYPQQSCLLYRGLIIQSARWPKSTLNLTADQTLRLIGYGIPDLNRALGNSPNRITLINSPNTEIKAKQVDIYQVTIPKDLLNYGNSTILLEITLSYKAEPHRTRRNYQKYLSTWLKWNCSKIGEEPNDFFNRVLAEKHNSEQSSRKSTSSPFQWTLGEQKNYGKTKEISRSNGTIQKDWAIVKSYELTEGFCIAIIGNQGWNKSINATVPYSLIVSFEALESTIPIYSIINQAQIEIKTQQKISI